MKKIISFSSENVQDFEVKFSIYLNRRVFVMAYDSVSSDGVTDHLPTATKDRLSLLPYIFGH